MSEADLISCVNIIAEAHNCRTISINPETKVIKIEGPDEKQIECAVALEEMLDEYLTDEPDNTPSAVMGWPV